jgi:lipopolysaccharide transport system permease protein
LIVVLTLTLGLGMGMAISVLSSRYRDFAHAVPFVLQVLLYGSPVAYSIEILPNSLAQLYAINPLVPLLGALRWSLLGTAAPTAGEIVVGSISGAVIVGVGILVFSRGSRDLADVI